MHNTINLVTSLIYSLARLVMEFIAYIDGFLVELMNAIHIPPNIQTIFLVVVAIALVVLAVRVLGGVFAALIVVLLLLLVLHRIDPTLAMPHGDGHAQPSSGATKT